MRYLVLLLFFFPSGIGNAQDSLNMTLLARWDDDTLPLGAPGNLNLQYNSVWGLVVNGKEIAVLGGSRHVFFFDVTEPTHPQLIAKFAGTKNIVSREFKSYKNRVYAVSDATTEGLMIFDLSNAPENIDRTYWSNEFFEKAHTITLDTVSGRIYLNGTNVGAAYNGLVILDVSQNPDRPALLAKVDVEGGYVHDAYVRNDTVYASSGDEGYFVLDCGDPQNPKTLASISTGGYNHNSWLTTDGNYAYYTEEIPRGRPIHIVDLRKLKSEGEIEVVHDFLDNLTPGGNLAVPHNLFIRNDLLFVSQYEDGLLVYDICQPAEPKLIAHYDTHPENLIYNGYFGCWGNYPWLPSGTIIASDMQNGLFLLKMVSPIKADSDLKAAVFPNPAHNFVRIGLPEISESWTYRIFNAAGCLVKTGSADWCLETIIDLESLASGMYFLEIRTKEGTKTIRKLVVT